MRVPILSARSGWHVDELKRAFHERGHEAVELRYEQIVSRYGHRRGITSAELSLEETPAILARIIPDGSLEQLIVRVDVLHALEERGIYVCNSASVIERTVDKAWTTSILEAAGLPTPETVVCETFDAAMNAFRTLGRDVIAKPLFGSMGLGMTRLTDEATAWRVFRAIERIRGVFYVQQTIDHGGRDIRAFVVSGRVIAAIERRAEGWCTSVAQGAQPAAITLDESLENLAVRAAAAVGADYAGVDLLSSVDNETYVIEVNGIPGWRGLQQTTQLDVAGEIADHVLHHVNGL